MAPRGACIALAIASASGCSDGGIFISLPPSAGAQVAVISLGGQTVAFRADESFVVDAPLPATATLLLYDAELDALPFSAGPLSSSGNCSLLSAAPPSAIFSIAISDEVEPMWQIESPDSEALAAFADVRVSAPDGTCERCVEWDAETVIIPNDGGDPIWAVALPNGGVLFGTSDYETFELTTSGELLVVEANLNDQLRAVDAHEDGDLWFAGWGDQIFRGRFENGALNVTLASTVGTSTSQVLDLAVLTSSSGFEAVTLTLADVRHFESGGGWRSLTEVTPAITRPKGAVARLSATEIDVVWGYNASVWRIENGELFDDAPAGLTEAPTTIALLESGPTLVTSRNGTVYQRPNRSWSPIEAGNFGIDAHAIADFRGGFLVAGEAGGISQYIYRRGFCESQPGRSRTIRGILPYADGDLLLYGDDSNSQSTMTILRPL